MKRTPLNRYKRINPRRPTPRTHKLVTRLEGPALTMLWIECWHRDKGRCQECGKKLDRWAWKGASDSYHMAHRRNKRMYGDTLDNVRALCGDCHRAEHGNKLPRKAA